MRKKCILALALAIIAIFYLSPSKITVPSKINALADGRAECVAELYTDSVLHSKNADARMPMASTTKIMTALIIAEDCELDEVITVPDSAVGIEGSSIYLKRGEQISVRDLLYGMMLRSGNDSAAALAIHHSGSTDAFAQVMNRRANEIGAINTNFTNPSGLPDENHYTTASDLCKLACAAMKNPTFKEIVGTINYNGDFRSYLNKNKILTRIEGANGIKTGYTIKAGRCLVSSAERDGMDVVCVVLNCPDMYERSAELIENAFNKYEVNEITQEKIFICNTIPSKLAKNYKLLTEKNSSLQLKIKPKVNSDKVIKGDLVGELQIYSQNNLIFNQNLYSIVNVK